MSVLSVPSTKEAKVSQLEIILRRNELNVDMGFFAMSYRGQTMTGVTGILTPVIGVTRLPCYIVTYHPPFVKGGEVIRFQDFLAFPLYG
jgi:hypothetical protein